MISIPMGIWIAYNTLVCISAATGKGKSRPIAFSLALGLAAISCALLAGGMQVAFLGLEIGLWFMQMALTILVVGLRPPGEPRADANALAVGASLRLAVALSVWFCI